VLTLGVETLVGQLMVPTLQFVLFLYVQHIQKISLRASLVSGSDEYPLNVSVFVNDVFAALCRNRNEASAFVI